MEELLRTKAKYGPGLKTAREFIERDGINAPLNPRLAMYVLLHNDVNAAWQVFQNGCAQPPDKIVSMCMSEGMTKLLLILGIPLRCTKFTTVWARRVLILNGLYVPKRNWTHFTAEESDLETRRDFIHLRQSVIAILNVKKAGKLVRWDKFLLREIALSLWDLRYEKLPKKPALIDPMFIQALGIVIPCWIIYWSLGALVSSLFIGCSLSYLFRDWPISNNDLSPRPFLFIFSVIVVLSLLIR